MKTSDPILARTPKQPVSAEGAFAKRILSGYAGGHVYTARFADSEEDIRSAQALRFSVFNLEHGEGLAESFFNGLDADPFDAVCDHLLIESLVSGEVVGTYRLQTGKCAALNLGYYSAQEFNFDVFEKVRDQFLELGRACVHRDHRNRGALGLLWRSIGEYAHRCGARYLGGCSSVSTQDSAAGAAVFAALRPHYASSTWWTYPRPEYACALDICSPVVPRIPRLLAAYLSLGAKISAPPAIDRAFGTIDFLTILDLAHVTQLTPPQSIPS